MLISQGEQKIAEIKKAGPYLFSENSFYSISISQVAKEAGVSKGLIYNYLDNKI